MALFVVGVRVTFRLIFGEFTFDSAISAVVEGSKLAAWVAGFGLLNVFVDFRRLLKYSPKSLKSFTTALNISLNLVPEMARSLSRVRTASRLRAHRRGSHLIRSVIVPVMSNAVDQSINLADSMESRGFGRSVNRTIFDGAVTLSEISFSYGSAEPILKDVSLSILPGQFAVIAGDTGSGKSTLLKLIQANFPDVAFVSQSPRQSFVSETVFDELAFSLNQLGRSRDEIRKRVFEVGSQLALEPLFERDPQELSAGWQQRVAIAASLTAGSRTLLLDEPFSALDEPGTAQLVETLRKLKSAGVSVVVAEHRLTQLQDLPDQYLTIRDGRIFSGQATQQKLIPRNPNTGKVTALFGANGSGKTTYLQKLAKTDGVLVPQPASDLLFLNTVNEELAQSDTDAKKPAGTTAKIFEKFVPNFNGEQNPRDLSEGQKLSLALSVQLVKDKQLLLLDEPTLGFDVPSRQSLLDELQIIAEDGVKIIVATHDIEFAGAIATETITLDLVAVSNAE